MEDYLSKLLFSVTEYGAKLVIAVVVFFVGRFLINKLTKRIEAGKAIQKIDGTARTAMVSFIRIALFVVLLVIVVSIMGIPMASIIAILASAGVTIGLALQGALSNLAGGIMILVFKPFKVDDYVEANGVQGVVTDITLFYTKMLTLDNKRITVPNGTLMNANVIDYTAEDIRRVDLTFLTAKSEAPEKVQNIMLQAMASIEKVLSDPEPFARVSGGTAESMEFTARGWCKTADYWDVYFDMTQKIVEALGAAGIEAPVVRIAEIKK